MAVDPRESLVRAHLSPTSHKTLTNLYQHANRWTDSDLSCRARKCSRNFLAIQFSVRRSRCKAWTRDLAISAALGFAIAPYRQHNRDHIFSNIVSVANAAS